MTGGRYKVYATVKVNQHLEELTKQYFPGEDNLRILQRIEDIEA